MSEAAADTGSVTVVVAHRVRPEHEAEYLQWAASINDACRTFPGFAGIEFVRPVPGVQDDYVVIYRFNSSQHLDDWLNSEVRRAFLTQGQSLFDGEVRRHIIASRPTPLSGLVVSTRVKPGKDEEHCAWLKRINTAMARFPGHLGNEVLPPIAGIQEDWVVVVRFNSAEHLKAWFVSDVRKRFLEEAANLWETSRVEKFSGAFPGWFGTHAAAAVTRGLPPAWKQAMIVLLVLYPVVMLLGRFVSPWIASQPTALSIFIANLLSVSLLTWLFLPWVNRALGFWLTPDATRGRRMELGGIAIIVAGYALTIAIFLVL